MTAPDESRSYFYDCLTASTFTGLEPFHMQYGPLTPTPQRSLADVVQALCLAEVTA